MRYISKELGNSNCSIYAGLNPNFYVRTATWDYAGGYEIHLGVNISSQLSVGLIWNANWIDQGCNIVSNAEYIKELYGIDVYPHAKVHTGSIGVNLGYRF